jgi:dolichyl-diphosphooligosaccharide--protein glycosyltransferase
VTGRSSARRLPIAAAWCAVIAGALALRVLPAWHAVFGPQGVNFQGDDALYHVRTIHNLLAHFPWRSGFDPYALFPGGQNVPTGPFWDYLVAVTAWIPAAGAPSPEFVDAVAAWLPAILGALFPLPAYFLARRMFGAAAARFACLWVAVLSGGFLWLTHLGMADHHAAEAWFAFLTLVALAAAAEEAGARRTRRVVGAALALGCFLATRPAGIFLPAILGCCALWEPLLAGPVLGAVLGAALVFVPVTGSQWSSYTWISLALSATAAGVSLGSAKAWHARGWPSALRPPAALVVFAGAFAAAVAMWPGSFHSLWFEIRRVAGPTSVSRIVSTVQELEPIYRAGSRPGWMSVFEQAGLVWIPALPALAWTLWRALRTHQAALRLFCVWSLVAGAGTLLQARMIVYFAPVAAVLAGAACARALDNRRRWVQAAAMAAILALNLPFAVALVGIDSSPNQDWRGALAWLRRNSPDPAADARTWSCYYARVPRGAHGAGLPAWGVAVWWDEGYAVEQIAHRAPMANGTQSGAERMARFFTGTSPETAVERLRRAGARYVIVDPATPLFAGNNRSWFPVALRILGRDLDQYFRILLQTTDSGLSPLPVYLPDYYRTMAARLYLSDGAEVPGTGPWLFEVKPADSAGLAGAETITWYKRFESESAAEAYTLAHPYNHFIMGCLDAGASCVALPAVKGLRRVWSSDPLPVSPERTVRAVKIFQVVDP